MTAQMSGFVAGDVERTWHAVSFDDVARELVTRPEGLDPAEVAARREAVGENVLEEAPPPRLLTVVVDQFRSPLIYILLIATAVTLALGEFLDAAVIAAALLLNAAIGTVQQRKAEASVRSLQQLLAPQARVVRDGRAAQVESRDLVLGDVVLLGTGDRVPADLRLADVNALSVDESLLTGESLPVQKQVDAVAPDVQLADRTNLVFSGTVVARGRGRGYVIATGGRTELGRIAEHIRTAESPVTPLQRQLDQFAKVIGLVVLGAALLAFTVGFALGQSPQEMFIVAVALAVSAIPESLAVVFTVVLAVGVTRMARRKAIVRQLAAVETLGSTTVICSDKTGTLTRNEMTVQEARSVGRRFVTQETNSLHVLGTEALIEHRELYLALLSGVLVSEAEAHRVDDDLHVTGDPTEAALLRAAADVGLEPSRLRREHQLDARLPFEPERRYAAAVATHEDGPTLFVQGAPERVLAMCTQQMRDGIAEPIDPTAVASAIHAMADVGLRVLAFAVRTGPHAELTAMIEAPHDLTFVGLQGMHDPPRDGVGASIVACHEAGMRIVMITGDHAATATAIAAQIGLIGRHPVVTGADLDRLDDDELHRLLPDIAVFARVAPEQKLRIAHAFRERGEVVAVTGDGVNDAPALQAAHIGIAMGRHGTDVAREASDMVLADDNFVSIRAAIEEGRIAFDNLRKATFFLISSGAAEILMVLTGLVLGWPLVLLPAQLLWLNLVTNGLQDMALAFEPGEPGVLKRPPRPQREGLVSRTLWQRTVLVAIVMAAGTLAVFAWTLDQGRTIEEARTAAMTTMVLFQAVHVGNSRQEHRSALESPPWTNRFLLAAVVGALSLHAAALHLPGTQLFLRVQPLSLRQWAAAALIALSVLVAVEIDKAVRRTRRATNPSVA
jgi:calcium-translocating P-type ATPase